MASLSGFSELSVDLLVGARLRALRRRLELTQEDTGKMLGVAFQQIQKYETGKNKIPLHRLVEFSEKTGVPVCFFLKGSLFSDEQKMLCKICNISRECETLLRGKFKIMRDKQDGMG